MLTASLFVVLSRAENPDALGMFTTRLCSAAERARLTRVFIDSLGDRVVRDDKVMPRGFACSGRV